VETSLPKGSFNFYPVNSESNFQGFCFEGEDIRMNKHSRKPSASGLLYLAAVSASLTFPFAAHAANDPTKYECNLNEVANGGFLGCISGGAGGGTTTSVSAVTTPTNPALSCQGTESALPSIFGTGFCGANAPPVSNSTLPIYAWNACRWVNNTNTSSASYSGHFIPFGSATEWAAFRSNLPAGVSLTTCAVPYSVQPVGTPTTTNIMEYGTGKLTAGIYQNCTASYPVTNPDVYGKTGISIWPTTPTIVGSVGSSPISCNSGATIMMAAPQFIAGTYPDTPTTTLSWNANSKYSPDVDLSITTPMPVEEGQPVTITWTVTPHPNAAGAAVTCSVSPAGWGPGASFTGATTNSASVIPGAGTTTYTLTCSTDSPALTSVASSAATTYPPAPPCCWG
jgi:hypothetical protein